MQGETNANLPYLNPSLPVADRVNDLISRMTLEEKVSQMVHPARAIDRLDVPAYNWWNECLHGVGRAGIATVFPQAIGLGATWDVPLMSAVATATSDEARAKHHEAVRNDIREIYFGLTFWSPNINIFRDPRWGRGHETYGEDPHLTARLGVAFVQGLQGDDPRYLKLVATPKHYAVHSGPEPDRHRFDARVNQRVLWDTYLPAFEATVREANAQSIMGAYNRVNGEPACAQTQLLQEILRDQWGFDGYVVSDCGAIKDFYDGHDVVETPEEAAALAVKKGCDLNCGETYSALLRAVGQGLISETELDVSLKRLFTARFRLGMFDPTEMVPYAQIPHSATDSPKHRRLALKAARESLVLLKNDGILPLQGDYRTIAVIGPYADDQISMRGNYNGTPLEEYTVLDGIKKKAGNKANVLYVPGTDISGLSTQGFEEATTVARFADLAIVVLGSSPLLEGEEGGLCGLLSDGDRTTLDLPGKQGDLLKEIHATGTPVVLVLINGSALAVNWADENVPGILEAWYPGQAGGTAVAEALFGHYNPGGRLPVTFYKSLDQIPPFDDYSMTGHTYRYFRGEPLYPFGYGLSYTQFQYSNLALSHNEIKAGRPIRLSVEVDNVGGVAGDEVVQVYVTDLDSAYPRPVRQLLGFRRISLKPGQKKIVRFRLTPADMSVVDDQGKRLVEPGRFQVSVGGGQPASRGTEDGVNLLTAEFEVTGKPIDVRPS